MNRRLQDQVVRKILAEIGRSRMTQKTLCELAGISQSTWSEAKNLHNDLGFDMLQKIMNVLPDFKIFD